MQFREFAERLLGSKVKVKLLRRILSEETLASERELALLIGVSHAAVNKALKEFHGMNLITPLRVGNAIIWNVNKESYAYEFLSQFPDEIKKTPYESLLEDIRSFVGTTAKKIILFGSVALGRESAHSDIDLFIIVDTDAVRKSLLPVIAHLNASCLRKYGNKVSPNIVT